MRWSVWPFTCYYLAVFVNIWYYQIPLFFTDWGADMMTLCFTNLRLLKS